MTKERWAQIGIATQFLIIVRTLGEVFRLKHVDGTNFSDYSRYVICRRRFNSCLLLLDKRGLYFFRRYVLSSSIALATVIVLLVYKIAVTG